MLGILYFPQQHTVAQNTQSSSSLAHWMPTQKCVIFVLPVLKSRPHVSLTHGTQRLYLTVGD